MSIVQAMMGVVAQQPAGASNGLLNGLVSCYQFNNDATDETGTSNATATNIPYVTSPKIEGTHSGEFVRADSPDMDTNQSLAGYTALSLTAWVYPTQQTSTSLYEIMNDRAGGGASTGIAIFKDAAAGSFGNVYAFQVRTAADSTTGLTLTLAEVPLNDWTHLALTYDGSNVRLYRNGSFDSSYSQSGSIAGTVANLHIGTNANLTGRYFDGYLDQICIYDEALDATRISALYNSGAGLPYSSFTT